MDEKIPVLNFFIDPEHYPYDYDPALSINAPAHRQLKLALSSANTWLLWTLRTYLELKDRYTCRLTDQMPENGIVFFFRGSVSMEQRPGNDQFWVCLVADSTWHPFSQINVFQNLEASRRYRQSFFKRHWPPLSVLRRRQSRDGLKRIYYMGDRTNLSQEFRSADWTRFLKTEGFTFVCPPVGKWNDYRKADAALAARSFDGDPYLNKPASKLINAWLGHVVFIGTPESAYEAEKKGTLDMVIVESYAALKITLLRLRDDLELFHRYQDRSAERSTEYNIDIYRRDWEQLIDGHVLPLAATWFNQTRASYRYYLFMRKIQKIVFSLRYRLNRNRC
ncbi:hypothetical protein [Mucilaginibacter sp.]|uniref:hypothetical protein n=1 Tax=Mucilaginibacter sp. TaxID=1882438 RepID=UPI0035BBAA48